MGNEIPYTHKDQNTRENRRAIRSGERRPRRSTTDRMNDKQKRRVLKNIWRKLKNTKLPTAKEQKRFAFEAYERRYLERVRKHYKRTMNYHSTRGAEGLAKHIASRMEKGYFWRPRPGQKKGSGEIVIHFDFIYGNNYPYTKENINHILTERNIRNLRRGIIEVERYLSRFINIRFVHRKKLTSDFKNRRNPQIRFGVTDFIAPHSGAHKSLSKSSMGYYTEKFHNIWIREQVIDQSWQAFIHVLAHEIGHSLGLEHGDDVGCGYPLCDRSLTVMTKNASYRTKGGIADVMALQKYYPKNKVFQMGDHQYFLEDQGKYLRSQHWYNGFVDRDVTPTVIDDNRGINTIVARSPQDIIIMQGGYFCGGQKVKKAVALTRKTRLQNCIVNYHALVVAGQYAEKITFLRSHDLHDKACKQYVYVAGRRGSLRIEFAGLRSGLLRRDWKKDSGKNTNVHLISCMDTGLTELELCFSKKFRKLCYLYRSYRQVTPEGVILTLGIKSRKTGEVLKLDFIKIQLAKRQKINIKIETHQIAEDLLLFWKNRDVYYNRQKRAAQKMKKKWTPDARTKKMYEQHKNLRIRRFGYRD